MTRRPSFALRTLLIAVLVILGVAVLASCQMRQFRQPSHEPAMLPLNAR